MGASLNIQTMGVELFLFQVASYEFRIRKSNLFYHHVPQFTTRNRVLASCVWSGRRHV
jgi:hypothetical protein